MPFLSHLLEHDLCYDFEDESTTIPQNVRNYLLTAEHHIIEDLYLQV
jgi:hypothetical protein